MRRAFVISIAIHLLLIASLFDRALPLPERPSIEGGALRARLGVPADVAHSSPAPSGGRSTSTAADEAWRWSTPGRPSRQTRAVKPANVRRQFIPPRTAHAAVSELTSDPLGEADSVLPADVERELRLLLARRLRQLGGLRTPSGKGTVKLSVAFLGAAGGSEVRLMQSSGDTELDTRALSSLKVVLSDVSLPQAAQTRRFRVPLVLEYGLGD